MASRQAGWTKCSAVCGGCWSPATAEPDRNATRRTRLFNKADGRKDVGEVEHVFPACGMALGPCRDSLGSWKSYGCLSDLSKKRASTQFRTRMLVSRGRPCMFRHLTARDGRQVVLIARDIPPNLSDLPAPAAALRVARTCWQFFLTPSRLKIV